MSHSRQQSAANSPHVLARATLADRVARRDRRRADDGLLAAASAQARAREGDAGELARRNGRLYARHAVLADLRDRARQLAADRLGIDRVRVDAGDPVAQAAPRLVHAAIRRDALASLGLLRMRSTIAATPPSRSPHGEERRGCGLAIWTWLRNDASRTMRARDLTAASACRSRCRSRAARCPC